jgi:hypothetical protein
MTTLCAAPLSSSTILTAWNTSPNQYFGWLYAGTVVEGALPATAAHVYALATYRSPAELAAIARTHRWVTDCLGA